MVPSRIPDPWDGMVCLHCGAEIKEPKQRLRLLFSLRPVPCLFCGTLLQLKGNHWLSFFIGSGLMLLGGRLWSQDFSTLLSVLFLCLGVAVFYWGVKHVRVERVGELPE